MLQSECAASKKVTFLVYSFNTRTMSFLFHSSKAQVNAFYTIILKIVDSVSWHAQCWFFNSYAHYRLWCRRTVRMHDITIIYREHAYWIKPGPSKQRLDWMNAGCKQDCHSSLSLNSVYAACTSRIHCTWLCIRQGCVHRFCSQDYFCQEAYIEERERSIFGERLRSQSGIARVSSAQVLQPR